MRNFIKEKLGHSVKYGTSGAHSEYYRELNKKTVILSVISGLTGIANLIGVFVNGSVKLIFTDPSDVTRPTLIVSSLPWFNLIITLITCVYIFFSIYYFNTIKEELE